MSKYNMSIVEMHKIINKHPIDTLWVYWETDIYYNIIGSGNQITIRTHDKVLSNSEAKLITATASIDLPIGTYSIGTYSNPYPNANDDYKLIVATVGYISEVYNGLHKVDAFGQTQIPNEGEFYFEWITTDRNLRPLYLEKDNRYVTGALYSVLDIRYDAQYLLDDNGDILTDDNNIGLVY